MPLGRPPKPTVIRKAEGNLSGRPLNENEPEPTPGFGKRPKGLSTFGKNIWRTVTEELDRMNLVTVVDRGALVAAIAGADQAYVADAQLRKLMALVAEDKAGQETFYRISMLNSVSKKGWQQYKAFATEFGLTPASRTRLTVEPGTKVKGSRAPVDDIEAALCSLPVRKAQPVQ